jgi:gamma-glutamylcyclotransferase (GGCT)/AIG2-like uncharacterized protein YtfP
MNVINSEQSAIKADIHDGNLVFFAFYGSLRPGMGNHAWALQDKRGVYHINTTKIPGFKMYSLGFYPMVFQDNGPDAAQSEITVDIFKITNKDIISDIDGMEIGAGYKRLVVEIATPAKSDKKEPSSMACVIYVGDDRERPWFSTGAAPQVVGGDWVAHKTPAKINDNSK